jgi:predicted metal-binding protein
MTDQSNHTDNTDASPVELLICTTCRGPANASGEAPDPDAERHGTRLHRALSQRDLPEGVILREVKCLSNCKRGCSIVLRGPDRWSYVYGNFDVDEHLDTIIQGATRYRDAADGIVPLGDRPEHFRKNCIARMPPLTDPSQ